MKYFDFIQNASYPIYLESNFFCFSVPINLANFVIYPISVSDRELQVSTNSRIDGLRESVEFVSAI